MGGFYKIIFLFVALISAPVSFFGSHTVNPDSSDVLSKMSEALKNHEALELFFEMTVTDEKGSVIGSFEGTVQTQGYAFNLVNPELEVFCDGDSKWIYNTSSGELTIFPNDTTQIDLVENPVGFLLSLNAENSQFKIPSQAQQSKKPGNGKPVWSVELTSKNRYAPYKSLTICIDAANFLPSVLMYKSTDGNSYTIIINSIKAMPVWPLTNFQFPSARLQGLAVTDLR